VSRSQKSSREDMAGTPVWLVLVAAAQVAKHRWPADAIGARRRANRQRGGAQVLEPAPALLPPRHAHLQLLRRPRRAAPVLDMPPSRWAAAQQRRELLLPAPAAVARGGPARERLHFWEREPGADDEPHQP
jgi:hypothetical protein